MKIGLFYPILSKVSDELLEISPCFFYGALPNQIGNMCIAGHNYANQTHFAKLHLLNIGDVIEIYDLNGLKLDYSIYSKEEIPASDISCLSQDTNNEKEIPEIWEELEQEGYTVIDLKKVVDVDLLDNEYLADGFHPNAKAWNVIIPQLIKELNIT